MKHSRADRRLAFITLFLILAIVAVSIIATYPDEPPTASYRCTDTDNGDAYVAGTNSDWRSGQRLQDRCVDAATLEEFACAFSVQEPRGKSTAQRIVCPCSQGACVAPNLVITDVILSRPARVDEEFKITFRVGNTGSAAATAVDFEAYFEPGYGILVEAPQTPLEPGQTAQITYSAQYRVPGTFTLVSIVDPFDVVEETDEDDNQHAEPITVHQ